MGQAPTHVDDLSVTDDEEVWRRIPADKVTVKDGQSRPQSGMFSDSRDGSPMSASRAKCYRSPADANVAGFLMVALNVGYVRSLELGIATEPPTEDPGHVWVFGGKPASVKRKLARHATWVIPPPIGDA